MNEAFLFAFCAFLLLAVILFGVMRALFLPILPRESDDNLALLKAQLNHLKEARQKGWVSENEFSAQQTDLQQRVLEENAPPNAPQSWQASPKMAWFLVLMLPILSLALYALWGNPNAMQLELRDPILATENNLMRNWAQNPNDPALINPLLGLCAQLQNAGEKARALSILENMAQAQPQNADFLSFYASALWEKNGSLAGEPLALLNQALLLNPNHPQALFFSGFAYFELGELTRSKDFFQQAATRTTDSQTQLMIQNALLAIEARLNPQSSTLAAAQIVDLKNKLTAQKHTPEFQEKGVPVWWILAKAAHNLQQYDLALSFFEEGQDFLPEDAEILALHAGTLWRVKKDATRAKQLLQQAQKINAHNEWVIFYQAYLEPNAQKRAQILQNLKMDEKTPAFFQKEVDHLKKSLNNPR